MSTHICHLKREINIGFLERKAWYLSYISRYSPLKLIIERSFWILLISALFMQLHLLLLLFSMYYTISLYPLIQYCYKLYVQYCKLHTPVSNISLYKFESAIIFILLFSSLLQHQIVLNNSFTLVDTFVEYDKHKFIEHSFQSLWKVK